MSANTWALTLILHRTQRAADEAINRALDCSLFHAGPAIHSASRRRGARDAPGHAPERTVAAAIWDTSGGLVTHRMIFEGAMHHMHQGENKRREEHCVVHQTAKKSSPWTQRFAYEDIKRVLERAMISSAVLA